MSARDGKVLAETGTVFLHGGGRDFNEETAYHSSEYLSRSWGRLFGRRLFVERGVGGYQDLSVWTKE